MEVAILCDIRFRRTATGVVYSPTTYTYSFFKQRYLTVFDHVRVIARVAEASGDLPQGSESTEGPGVDVISLGNWTGGLGFLRHQRVIGAAMEDVMDRRAAAILIVPSGCSSVVFRRLAGRGYPFALEVVGDPWDSFAPRTTRHPLRPFVRSWGARILREQCRCASAAVYVTKASLQGRYPCDGITAGISDVVLGADAFATKDWSRSHGVPTLVSVGTMTQLYKGQDVLIDAVARCAKGGFQINLVLVGDGRYRERLEQQARHAGVAQFVRFAGHVQPASAVRAELDGADLFVLASRTEGLPRAMVEAMARGLPCIGSAVGGIPELLDPDSLVPPDDAQALAERIQDILANPDRMREMSRKGLAKAAEYREELLRTQRQQFYERVKETTREQRPNNPRWCDRPQV